MGINIYVYEYDKENKRRLKENTDWDSIRYANDRYFGDVTKDCSREQIVDDVDTYYRPKDFSEWRKAIEVSEFNNKERYYNLLDLLDKNKSNYIYISW